MHLDRSTGIGTISITDHAQSVLGDVVFVELPKPGDEVVQGGMYQPHPICNQKKNYNAMKDQIGAVESVKAASDIVCSPDLECRRR